MSRIIDFHAHAFPDAIADRAVDTLEKGCDYRFRAHTDGRASSLVAALEAAGVDCAVLCPIATKPEQFEGILQWVLSVCGDRLIGLASVHPDSDAIEGQLERVAECGLIGVKIHPMYQAFKLDEPRLDRLYARAAELGLLIEAHCGYDVAFGEDDSADVERIARVLDRHPDLPFVATHLGGWHQWERSTRLLAGRGNLWFETSACLELITPAQATEIIEALGVERVLFGTDSPWFAHDEEIQRVRRLSLDVQTQNDILGGNAGRLLARLGRSE